MSEVPLQVLDWLAQDANEFPIAGADSKPTKFFTWAGQRETDQRSSNERELIDAAVELVARLQIGAEIRPPGLINA